MRLTTVGIMPYEPSEDEVIDIVIDVRIITDGPATAAGAEENNGNVPNRANKEGNTDNVPNGRVHVEEIVEEHYQEINYVLSPSGVNVDNMPWEAQLLAKYRGIRLYIQGPPEFNDKFAKGATFAFVKATLESMMHTN